MTLFPVQVMPLLLLSRITFFAFTTKTSSSLSGSTMYRQAVTEVQSPELRPESVTSGFSDGRTLSLMSFWMFS